MTRAYPWVWIAWVTWFLAWELGALLTGNARLTLSDYVWRLEEINARWTFLRYFVAVFCVWLALHMTFGWFR